MPLNITWGQSRNYIRSEAGYLISSLQGHIAMVVSVVCSILGVC